MERNLITVRDVGTLRRQVSEGLSWSELAEKVFHDPLTKLANRVLDTVARLGGDEFAILLADSGSVGDAMAIAKRVLAAMHEPFATPEGDTHVGASVGISVFGDGNRVLAEGLLEQADAAMYAAKISGTNRFVVHGGEPEERTLADRRVDVERRWR